MPGRLPNILLIMADQLRRDALSCCGGPAGLTPNLDRLAGAGVSFDCSYAASTICTPSRASLMTGRPLAQHDAHRLNSRLGDQHVLFPDRLRAAGYRTGLIGKLSVSANAHEAHHRHPHDGFDVYEWCSEGSAFMDVPMQAYARWLESKDPALYQRMHRLGRGVGHIPEACHPTRWAADRTIAFIRGANDGRPFFATMSVFDPHNPYDDHPAGLEQRVDPGRVPAPVALDERLDALPDALRDEHAYGRRLTSLCCTPECAAAGDDPYAPDRLRRLRRGYYASVALIDDAVGRVLAELESLGLADDTLVVFTSDHGDMLGDHRMFTKGAGFYDAVTRVPLLMRWPGSIPPGRRVDELTQLYDVAATLLRAAGIDTGALTPGMPDARDLLALMAGDRTAARTQVVTAYRNSGRDHDPPVHGTMLRDERYKLNVYHPRPDSLFGPLQGQLFDLASDPHERHNLWSSSSHRGVRTRMLDAMSRYVDRSCSADTGEVG